jgi:hypothetical protein
MIQLTTVALCVGTAATAAWSGEQWGTVKSVDQSQKRVVLNDGTPFWLMPGLSLDLLAQGKRVKVVYDEREGKKWIRSVEATN